MNQNIEVISSNLWAVRFSLIPFIKEIYYEPKPNVKSEDDFGFITKQRVFILNRECKWYPKLKEIFPALMRKPTLLLKTEYKKISRRKPKNMNEAVYQIMIKVELRRRAERG